MKLNHRLATSNDLAAVQEIIRAAYTRIGYAETHRIEENGLRRVYMLKSLGKA